MNAYGKDARNPWPGVKNLGNIHKRCVKRSMRRWARRIARVDINARLSDR